MITMQTLLNNFYNSPQLALITFLFGPVLAVCTLVIGIASFGASFGLRKMYVKALLKIFEYATNIKEEKLKNCEDLLDREITNQLEKEEEIERLKTLRLESFKLNPRSSSFAKLHHHHKHGNHHHHPNHIDHDSAVDSSSSKQTTDSSSSPSTRSNSGAATTAATVETTNEPNNNYLGERSSSHIDSGLGSPSSVSSHSSTDLRSLHESYSDADLAAKNEHYKRDFQLDDIIDFVQNGMNAIIDDEVTKRFTTEELTVWNLLSRTNQQYEYISFRVTVLWLTGFLLRYCVLFPFRLILFILACFYTFVSTFLIGLIPESPIKRMLNWYGTLILHRILSRVFSAIITFHQRENRAKTGSICVANHTSPIDVIILSTDNCYSMIGQEHGGFTGMMQRAFSRASNHIWFDRSEARDRGLVARRMREHVEKKDNLPILIFPEGTCINNTSVMMFKKGCFEVDTTICPVAIKYDQRFGDAFWNSAKHSMLQYLMLMMTSWAIVVDVYYLPPMHRRENESAAEFASRVKSAIAKKGGFVDLNWDGMLKRTTPKLDLMYEQQQKYVRQLKID